MPITMIVFWLTPVWFHNLLWERWPLFVQMLIACLNDSMAFFPFLSILLRSDALGTSWVDTWNHSNELKKENCKFSEYFFTKLWSHWKSETHKKFSVNGLHDRNMVYDCHSQLVILNWSNWWKQTWICELREILCRAIDMHIVKYYTF